MTTSLSPTTSAKTISDNVIELPLKKFDDVIQIPLDKIPSGIYKFAQKYAENNPPATVEDVLIHILKRGFKTVSSKTITASNSLWYAQKYSDINLQGLLNICLEELEKSGVNVFFTKKYIA